MVKSLRDITPKENPELLKLLNQAHNNIAGVRSSKTAPGETGTDPGVDYDPKPGDERKWIAAHSIEKHADRVGNVDHPYTQPQEKYDLNFAVEKRHGRKRGADKKVYEAVMCNESPAGVMCEVHGMEGCPSDGKKLLLGGPKSLRKITQNESLSYDREMNAEMNAIDALRANMGSSRLTRSAAAEHLRKLGYRPSAVHHRSLSHLFREETQIDEVLTKATSVDDVIHDFVHSSNPKFAGKSRKERIKMALGAYYGMHPEKKRSVEECNAEGPYAMANYAPEGADGGLAVPLLQGDDSGADMVKAELRALANKAMHLNMTMPEGMHVEPWVQAKIAQAKELVSSVHDYMVYGDHDKPEEDEEGAPYEGGWDASGGVPNTYGPAGSGNPFGPQV
jgi:hypothetical protein